ncbi:MAG: T9SS type A sorting domain-containing protein [Saprospiraceae bacterium]
MKFYLILGFTLVAFLLKSQQTKSVIYNGGNSQFFITINPITIYPNGCNTGNYYVSIPFTTSFSGVPSNLYTLRGTIDCTSQNAIAFDLPEAATNNGTANSSTATAIPCSALVSCSTIHIVFEGPGLTTTIDFSAIKLPISLAAFSATNVDNKALIEWTAYKPENFDRFELQRSFNYKDWITIYQEHETESSDKYHYYDNYPIQLAYYRLKMVDIDGSFVYSGVEVVKINGKKTFEVYPNPFQEQIIINNYKPGEPVNISDISGKIIGQYTNTGSSFSINSSHMANGLYFLKYKNEVLKLVKG